MSRKKTRAPQAAPDDADPVARVELVAEEPLTMDARVEEIHKRIVVRSAGDISSLVELFGSRRRVMWLNFLAGLARGVGFFLGVSILGGVLLGILALTFDKATATLGFKDLTLKQAVRSAYLKFDEIQHDLDEVKDELAKARATAPETEATPAGK